MSVTDSAVTSHEKQIPPDAGQAHETAHDHGEFIAHHFDSAQQQYDSGKLGIWLFLVTEILFFSGLFCAYTLYRVHHPEVFVEASTFLDKVLGGINTIVLLFSSLTMALAVRYSQLAENRKVAFYLTITMVCAALFLGIKAVEYSHKWDEGIFTRAWFNYHSHAGPPTLSPYLKAISIPFAILLGLSIAGGVGARISRKPQLATFLFCLAIMFGGYFLGAVGGKIYMSAKSAADGSTAAAAHSSSPSHESAVPHDTAAPHDTSRPHDSAAPKPAGGHDAAGNATQTPEGGQATPVVGQGETNPAGTAQGQPAPTHAIAHAPAELSPDVGIFFSIYYCMTGLHAFHVIGGMVALSWLLWRTLNNHWRPDYFGPVDFVGLYWHIVDLIWIFLFPLLYLIN